MPATTISVDIQPYHSTSIVFLTATAAYWFWTTIENFTVLIAMISGVFSVFVGWLVGLMAL